MKAHGGRVPHMKMARALLFETGKPTERSRVTLVASRGRTEYIESRLAGSVIAEMDRVNAEGDSIRTTESRSKTMIMG
jgi:hypothetical protein